MPCLVKSSKVTYAQSVMVGLLSYQSRVCKQEIDVCEVFIFAIGCSVPLAPSEVLFTLTNA